MKTLLTISLLLISILSFAQYNFIDPEAMGSPCGPYKRQTKLVDPFIDQQFCWADWQLKLKKAKKEKLIKQLKAVNNYVVSNNASDTSYIHKENLRFMDFNGDAAVDIVNHFLKNDILYLEFWKNTGKGFDLLIQLQGEILEFKKDEDSKGFTFLLYHEICCSDTHHIKKYRFDPDQETFQLAEAIASRGVVKPDDKKENLNIPVEIQDSFTLYELRFSGPNFPIGLVKGGAEGTILAEFTDLRNGKWYCVKLNPNISLAKSRYEMDIHRHADYTDFGVHYVGWVKAGLVTIKQQ